MQLSLELGGGVGEFLSWKYPGRKMVKGILERTIRTGKGQEIGNNTACSGNSRWDINGRRGRLGYKRTD